MKKMYIIECTAEEYECYWVSNFMGTDNYSTDLEDATLFQNKSAAMAIIHTFALDDECKISEVTFFG